MYVHTGSYLQQRRQIIVHEPEPSTGPMPKPALHMYTATRPKHPNALVSVTPSTLGDTSSRVVSPPATRRQMLSWHAHAFDRRWLRRRPRATPIRMWRCRCLSGSGRSGGTGRSRLDSIRRRRKTGVGCDRAGGACRRRTRDCIVTCVGKFGALGNLVGAKCDLSDLYIFNCV